MSNSINGACGEKEKYIEIAPLAQKFHQLSSSSSADHPYSAVSSMKIKDSSTPGYQTANASLHGVVVGIGGARGLFYKTPSNDRKILLQHSKLCNAQIL